LKAPNIHRMTDRNAPPVYTARGQVEGEDWPAVAAALNKRMAARRVGQQELAQLSGVSVSTLRQLQHGAGRRVQNKTLSAISRALDWPDDHLTGILVSSPRAQTHESADSDEVLDLLRQLETRVREMGLQLADLTTVIDQHSQMGCLRPGQTGPADR
jgi:DNA-binding Xre family transcriptional regulator